MSVSVCVRVCVRACVCVLPCERYERTQLSTMFFLCCVVAPLLFYTRFYFCFDFVSVCIEPKTIIKKNTELKQMNERKRREKQTNSALLAAHSIECIDIYIMLYFAIDTQIASNLWNQQSKNHSLSAHQYKYLYLHLHLYFVLPFRHTEGNFIYEWRFKCKILWHGEKVHESER